MLYVHVCITLLLGAVAIDWLLLFGVRSFFGTVFQAVNTFSFAATAAPSLTE